MADKKYLSNTIISTNPSINYAMIWEVKINTLDEIREKINQSKLSQIAWSKLEIEERVIYLKEILDLFILNKEKIVKSISEEMWMPISQARTFDFDFWMNYFSWYLENARKYLSPEVTFENEKELHTVFYEPKWLVVAVAPWNYPFFMFIWTCIQPLLAGNVVIYKTSKETILTWKLIIDIINKSSIPKWVIDEVFWDWSIWNQLINEKGIDFVTFTWSTSVWKSLQKIAVEKWFWCVMELWGSAPWIIFEDSNIDDVIETIYFLRYSNSGQMCDWLKRLIVHSSRYEELIIKLSKLLKDKKVWDSLNENIDIWPLVSERQLSILKDQFEDALNKWAEVIFSSNLDSNLKWAYFPPTLLWNISFDMNVWKEEVFWPILPVVKFNTLEEAISLANDTEYWLWAYIFTNDIELFKKVSKEIKSWMVQLNNLNYCIPQNPFGWYKNSWIGREHWKWWFHEFVNIKVISMNK